MTDKVAGPDGSALSEGLGPLAAAVRDVMAHQWSNNREAMDALTRLIDAANDAQSVLCMVADISHSGGLAEKPLAEWIARELDKMERRARNEPAA